MGYAQAPATSFADASVQGGISYTYKVLAFKASGLHCSSAPSACATQTATGSCALPPRFSGVASATGAPGSSCGIALGWGAAVRGCPLEPGTSVSYNIYRGTTPFFTPRPTNRVANTAATSYIDAVSPGLTYYYIVRAEDSTGLGSGPHNGGREDANVVSAGGVAAGARSLLSFWDFEAASDQGWTTQVTGDTTGAFVRQDPVGTFYGARPVQPEDDATPGAGTRAWITGNGPPGGRAGLADLDGTSTLI